MPPQPTAPTAGSTPDLTFHTGRVYIAARQRGADATAIGELALRLPHVLGSFLVVYLLTSLLPAPVGTILLVCWLLSGALVFHRPTERVLARYFDDLRHPTRHELARLQPIWDEVTTRAGVDGTAYELWIEDSDDLNASASAGHTVAVTTYSLNHLSPAQLAGVLAHELGHHRGGHTWALLLGYWYALPGRLAWSALRVAAVLLFSLARLFSLMGQVITALVMAAVVVAVAVTLWPLLLVFVTPYLMAAVGRRAELRADLHAAELGFAPAMIEVLQMFHTEEQAALDRARRTAGDTGPHRRSPIERLLSSHPETDTRIRCLENYLATVG